MHTCRKMALHPPSLKYGKFDNNIKHDPSDRADLCPRSSIIGFIFGYFLLIMQQTSFRNAVI
jgi:hypothetical protein